MILNMNEENFTDLKQTYVRGNKIVNVWQCSVILKSAVAFPLGHDAAVDGEMFYKLFFIF